MKPVFKACLAMIGLVVMVSACGCVSKTDFDKCRIRNQTQADLIEKLEANQEQNRLEADRAKRQYEAMLRDQQGCDEKMAALRAVLDQKNAMIAELAERVGQVALPPELNTALTDWASQIGSDVVSFDQQTGIVRFKSDLLFAKGSDAVDNQMVANLQSLAGILNSSSAEGFDVLIVGHTDDIRIGSVTQRMHPTNWHLSAHRAISVEKILADSGVSSTRIAVMGMGEFKPIEPNLPNKGGNPKNRRVEIYIVPAGGLWPGK